MVYPGNGFSRIEFNRTPTAGLAQYWIIDLSGAVWNGYKDAQDNMVWDQYAAPGEMFTQQQAAKIRALQGCSCTGGTNIHQG